MDSRTSKYENIIENNTEINTHDKPSVPADTGQDARDFESVFDLLLDNIIANMHTICGNIKNILNEQNKHYAKICTLCLEIPEWLKTEISIEAIPLQESSKKLYPDFEVDCPNEGVEAMSALGVIQDLINALSGFYDEQKKMRNKEDELVGYTMRLIDFAGNEIGKIKLAQKQDEIVGMFDDLLKYFALSSTSV